MVLIFLIFIGIIAGMLGGLLGIGGGILIMPALPFIIGLEPSVAAGTCIVAVFFTTLGGSYKHFKLGHICFSSILPIIISGLLSSLTSSFLFVYASKKNVWLDVATGILFTIVALRMLWEGRNQSQKKIPELEKSDGIFGPKPAKIIIGAVAGVFPGLLGIGTGAILVPAFSMILNSPIKIAIGSSLACFSLNAFVSSVLKLMQGFVQIPLILPLSFGTLIGARFGATLNGKVSSPMLKILFGMFFILIAIKYFINHLV